FRAVRRPRKEPRVRAAQTATRIDAVALRVARGRRLRDVLAPDLAVVFCGINPGLYSAAVGHHFAPPGTRFWAALRRAGCPERAPRPPTDRASRRRGAGRTTLVPRARGEAAGLGAGERVAGPRRLATKIRRWKPRCVAFLGVGAYRHAFGERGARIGP